MMRFQYKFIVLAFFMIWCVLISSELNAQQDTIAPKKDSVLVSVYQVKMSKDSLDAEIDATATDTMWLDNNKKQYHLIKDAVVKYKEIELKAYYIIFDFNTNVLSASGTKDSLQNDIGLPNFSQEEQKFNASSLKYNFKTKKGLAQQGNTKESDLNILSKKVKFEANPDTVKKGNILYGSNAIITTCDAKIPHYGILCSQQKIIPDKIAVIGPSVVVIGDVPTPLVLPFGFFPLSKNKRQGIIIPRDYETSERWGFGLRNIGYYIPINDYMDLTLLGDIYFRGSYELGGAVRYRKRYKYNGDFNMKFADRREELPESSKIISEKSFHVVWRHVQDPASNPFHNFGGNVDIQTNGFNNRNRNDAANVLTNSFSSNINYVRRFVDNPSMQLSIGFQHSQNTRNNQAEINFPNMVFQTGSIYPFKKKSGQIGPEKWFEKVFFTYNGNAKANLIGPDTVIFKNEGLQNLRYGVDHKFTSSYNTRVLKYFYISPSVNYGEVWNFNTIRKTFDPTTTIDTSYIRNIDGDTSDIRYTTNYGNIINDTLNAFAPFRTFQAALSVNTQLFGTVQMRKGWLRGLRHVMKPNASLSFAPDYSMNPTWFKTVDTDNRPDKNKVQRYTIFENGLFGRPPDSKANLLVNYSIQNIFEGKYFSKRDTTIKRFKIFDNLSVNGNYNLYADSLKWSPVSFNGTARFFKGITTLIVSGSFDPYARDANGRTINKFYRETNGQLLRFAGASFRFATSLSVQQLKDLKKKSTGSPNPNTPAREQSALEELVNNITLGHTFDIQLLNTTRGDTVILSDHTLELIGRIPISQNWRIDVGRIGYDFVAERLTYPDVGFYRDLHCWEMGMNWQPLRGTYTFFLRVKPSSLDFLSVPWRKSNQDTFF